MVKPILPVLFFLNLALAHMEKAHTPFQPMGKTAYTTSSFSENRGTRYHAGVDWSTEMQEGWPVLAPEDGAVELLRQSQFHYGKNLMFRGTSGELYLFAHLSGFHSRLDSVLLTEKFARKRNDVEVRLGGSPLSRFRKGDTLGFSGSTGIGNPHLHLELRDSSGTTVLDPCEHGIACADTILPQLLGAAVWDAQPGNPKVSITSAASLQAGCLEVDPSLLEPRIAIKLVDYSREPRENPMSLKEIFVRNASEQLYWKIYAQQTYGKMGRIREELLWSEEGNAAGDWHILAKGIDRNENIRASQMILLGKILRQGALAGKNKKIREKTRIELEFRDFTNSGTLMSLFPQASCQQNNDTTTPQMLSFQDSLLFTFLSRTWINFSFCAQGSQFRMLTTKGDLVQDSLCKLVEPGPAPLAAITSRWPRGGILEVRKDSAVRNIYVQALPAKAKAPVRLETPGVSMKLTPYPTPYPNAVAWERTTGIHDKDSTGKVAWVFHPKGLHIFGNAEICITAPEGSDSLAQLYWLGESTRQWFIFSKQHMQKDSSGMRQRCASPDELRDLTLHVDTIPPQLGTPRDTLAMVAGRPAAVVRIPVLEKWAGIPDGNAIEGRVDGKWIPVEFDSEPSEIVIERRWWNPKQSLQLIVRDELGNQTTWLAPVP